MIWLPFNVLKVKNEVPSHLLRLPLYASLFGFPGGSDSKEYACSAGDMGLIPGSRRFPGEDNGNPL